MKKRCTNHDSHTEPLAMKKRMKQLAPEHQFFRNAHQQSNETNK